MIGKLELIFLSLLCLFLGSCGFKSRDAYIKDLNDKNWKVRYNAVIELGVNRDVQAVPGLIERLKDENDFVREAAARSLYWIGDVRARGALEEALKDRNRFVREKAATALGKIGMVESLPALNEASRDADEGVREAANLAIQKIRERGKTTMDLREGIEYVWNNTRILRNVERNLFTFGDTSLPYFLVTELVKDKPSTLVKEGEVIVKRPLIYTPYADHPQFKGFGEKERELSSFILHRIAYIPPYTYQNASKSFYVSSDNVEETVARLNKRLDEKGDNLTAIIRTVMDMWEVSVMKYSIERMVKSLPSNINELKERGFLS